MTEFTLDTSGRVPVAYPYLGYDWTWEALTPFTQGYVEALFASMDRRGPPDWAICNNGKTREGYKSALVGFSDLAPETLARIIADCAARQASKADCVQPTKDGGRSFWTRRQAGDRPAFPPLTPYLGDDGKVYLK